MRLAVVVQRYGADVSGGAELHARYVAEHLASHAEVEVVTTCARDYVTWRNELSPGTELINGVTVRRFPVARERDVLEFGRLSTRVFEQRHSAADELHWLRAEGPRCPALIHYLRTHRHAHDYFIFFSYRYYHAFWGARAVGPRAILVPTAERDAALGLPTFGPLFRGVRALMYNSLEERALIHGVAHNNDVPGVVVGIGSEVPDRTTPERFRRTYGLREPFAIYVGRIDENKGCRELFDHFRRYAASRSSQLSLILIGNPIIPVPDHPRIRHLGFLPDEEKFDAMAAADVLIMPSYYESLSMVALEAWALGRPVLANGHCDVLKGQCIRSNAGLYYETYEEFAATLHVLETNRQINAALGRNGLEYFRIHYSWPTIERKYLDVIAQLDRETADGGSRRAVDSPPGWWRWRRWQRTIPASQEIVDTVAKGPVVEAQRSPSHQSGRRQGARRRRGATT